MADFSQKRTAHRRGAGIKKIGLGRLLCGFAIFSAIAFFAAANLPGLAGSAKGGAQAASQRNPQGLLSSQRLSPPVRGGSTVRFSPDGRYLSVQDPAGVYVVSRSPLKLVLHIDAADNYAARFSADSKTITLVTWSLMVGTWRLSDGERLDRKVLPIKDGCIDAEVSPDGRNLACQRTDFSLALYEISTGEQIFADTLHKLPSDAVKTPLSPFRFNFALPLDTRSAFAHPFGIFITRDPKMFANRGLHLHSIVFSADGQQMVVAAGFPEHSLQLFLNPGLHPHSIVISADGQQMGSSSESPEHLRFQISGKIIGLPGSLENRLNGSFQFLATDRMLVIEKDKPSEPMIVSLANGAVLSKPAFEADSAQPAGNPRYALLHNIGETGARLFDLQENHAVDVPPNLGLDVRGEELAIYTQEGDLTVQGLGEKPRQEMIRLPLAQTAQLRTAVVDGGLESLVLAVDGQGAVFHQANRIHLAPALGFFAAILLDSKSAILLDRKKSETHALSLDTATGTSAEAWLATKQTVHYAAGVVLLEYWIPGHPFGVAFWGFDELPPRPGLLPYRLRALEPATGNELWLRNFDEEPPIPFVDPQGDRLVFAWKAKSGGARAAAKQDARAWEELKTSKLNEVDTVFEVIDARTAKFLGSILVQTASGPGSFDSAFSEGKALIVVNNGIHVALYSLRDGTLKAQLVGDRAAASAQSALLALDEGGGNLTLYDLNTGEKHRTYHFPQNIAYTHFSDDGKRLFVLTQLQSSFILDVSSMGQGHAPAQD